MKEFKEIITIDDRLNYILFGIQSVHDRWFSGTIINKIFEDSINDQVSAKEYLLFDNTILQVKGAVEECEPETICLTVRSSKLNQMQFRNIVLNADYEVYRKNGKFKTN